MSSRHLITIVAPIGAAGMLFASLTPYHVLAIVGELGKPPGGFAEVSGSNLTLIMLVGLAGACLLSLGMIIAASQPLRPTPLMRVLFFAAAAAFGFAVPAIAYGNTQLFLTFKELAVSENVDAEQFLRGVDKAWLPMLGGHVFVVAGATLVFLAGQAASSKPASTWSALALVRLLLVLGCAFLLCLATLWTMFSVPSFMGIAVATTDGFRPEQWAGHVSGVILSVYLSLFGLAGFSLTSLLSGIARAPVGRELANG